MRAEVAEYKRLEELASLSEDEKWENGAPDWGLQTVLAFVVGGGVLVAVYFATVSSLSDIFPFVLFAAPFVAVYGAFVFGAYPHGTQKQRVDAATALAVYVGVVAVWLAARQSVPDEQLLRAIDTFAIFGQLASFLASIKESVLAWIAPTQFLVLTPAGKEARKAQRQLNRHLYVPTNPDEGPMQAFARQENSPKG
jgi:hypothetical protein